jgi:RNA 3'-terminal phosphate cyclase (ATP)
MLHIDGSQGEGGGQILRSSLALSMATGSPFRISNIRAGRPKPGLMRQHLTCVLAAQAISSAEVEGASVGSREVTFRPGPVKPGAYKFAIGTAGGTMLVLQAVLPAMLRAGGPSVVTIEGGTHNEHAPPVEFVEHALLPLLARAGALVKLTLDRHGFYPVGGGRVVVEVASPAAPVPLEVLARGERTGAHARAIVSRLSGQIAMRELEVLRERMAISEDQTEMVQVKDPVGPGNAASLTLRYEHITEVFSAVGAPGKSAESVARSIDHEARTYIASGKPVGPHLADQLMVPLAMLAGGRYATGPLTAHATTNMAVLRAFGVPASSDDAGVVTVGTVRSI